MEVNLLSMNEGRGRNDEKGKEDRKEGRKEGRKDGRKRGKKKKYMVQCLPTFTFQIFTLSPTRFSLNLVLYTAESLHPTSGSGISFLSKDIVP